MRISRERKVIGENIVITRVREEYPEHSFYYINSYIKKEKNILLMLRQIRSWLDINDLRLLTGFGFGFGRDIGHETLQEILPLVYLCDTASPSYDIQLVCTDKKDIEDPPLYDGQYCIRSLDHFDSGLHYISGIRPHTPNGCYKQAYTAFKTLKSCLEKLNIGYKGLARTWLYMDNILDWYDKLNLARSVFFTEEDIYDKLIPASTGIGLSNHFGSCLSLSAFAISGTAGAEAVKVIESPMQCPARDYESSFSRAVEIDMQKSKKLMISGTASIDSAGRTVYPDSVMKQIDHTMKVVKAILDSAGYLWDNTIRAVAYFPHRDDIGFFIDYCRINNIDSSFFMLTGGTVCRNDLLFELELDAVRNV